MGKTDCVEVCLSDGRVGMRDSKNPNKGELWFQQERWSDFIDFVRHELP